MAERGSDVRRNEEKQHIGKQAVCAFEDLVVAFLRSPERSLSQGSSGKSMYPNRSDGLPEVDIIAQPVRNPRCGFNPRLT